jgi:Integrase core domain
VRGTAYPAAAMGSVGNAYDNAMCESFFAPLECELLARHRFKTQAEARMAVFEFIEGFYTLRRRHSSIGYLSPVEYERCHRESAIDPDARELPACGSGRKNGSAGGRTKEWRKGGPNAVRSDTLIPSPQPSVKPGQVH